MKATPKIKQRIQALLAKARGTDIAAEAETFLAKAMELLEQYQLNIADLVDEGDPILEHVGLSGARSSHAWRWRLYDAVAQLYGCKAVTMRGARRYETRVVGRESAIITTDLMYPWIVEQVRSKAKAIAPLTGMSVDGQAKRVAAALLIRIHQLIEAAREKDPSTAAGRNALLVLNQTEAKFNELYPNVEMKMSKIVSDALSKQAADSIGLHRQTTGQSAPQLGHTK